MTTTQIKYGKIITAIQEDLTTGKATIKTFKSSELVEFVSNLECFAIQLNNTIVKRTINKIKELGFEVDTDESFGFDWEVKIYCTK